MTTSFSGSSHITKFIQAYEICDSAHNQNVRFKRWHVKIDLAQRRQRSQ
jgi:hypothetical protein